MSLDYEKIFNYFQRIIHFENIEYNEYTAILSTNVWPISGTIRAEISEYGTNELYVRYSEMASGFTISLKDSEEKNTEEAIKFILNVAKYNCEDERILQWPFNCNVNYVGNIMAELKDTVESSKKIVKSSGNFDEPDGVIFENDNFELVKRSGTTIDDEPYEEYEVNTKKDSAAYEQVVEVRVSKSKGGIAGENRIYISVGMPMNRDRSIPQLIEVLEDARDFARKVADYLGVRMVNIDSQFKSSKVTVLEGTILQ